MPIGEGFLILANGRKFFPGFPGKLPLNGSIQNPPHFIPTEAKKGRGIRKVTGLRNVDSQPFGQFG
jgi:hypothetical protein